MPGFPSAEYKSAYPSSFNCSKSRSPINRYTSFSFYNLPPIRSVSVGIKHGECIFRHISASAFILPFLFGLPTVSLRKPYKEIGQMSRTAHSPDVERQQFRARADWIILIYEMLSNISFQTEPNPSRLTHSSIYLRSS